MTSSPAKRFPPFGCGHNFVIEQLLKAAGVSHWSPFSFGWSISNAFGSIPLISSSAMSSVGIDSQDFIHLIQSSTPTPPPKSHGNLS
ncbi:hypothetical protein NPIL_275841 [Nephila pilipes]|uniref:Uncharacterized protein n=1 Tax=Nephila pilipes TaxID=299642 RepID=A0A8X6QHE6_NEPPI|nr:hypothetical protein NPIL_275841 [Nephila pilipes]